MPARYHKLGIDANGNCDILWFVNLPRIVKANPNDPEWKFPYATRRYIEKLRKKFEEYQRNMGKKNWHHQTYKQTHVLPMNRPNKIPWESVPPHWRARCQELFNRKVAIEKAKKIHGWPTPGKIRSIRMNCARAGRHYFNGENHTKHFAYLMARKMWILYQQWEVEQERKKFVMEREPMPHKILEVG